MPSGFTPSAANRQPVYVGDDTILGKLYLTDDLDLSQQDQAANAIIGQKRKVLTGATTLTAKDSGALCLFNTAAGYTFTLPAPVIGLYFDFLVTVTITSSAAKIITDAGTTFMVGTIVNVDGDTSDALVGFSANGSTHVAISMNGSTTGAILGTRVRLECITSTLWAITGTVRATGSVATPFATS